MNAFTKIFKIYIVANKLPLMTGIKISIGKQYLDDILIVSDSHRLIYTTGQLNIMKKYPPRLYHLKHPVDLSVCVTLDVLL